MIGVEHVDPISKSSRQVRNAVISTGALGHLVCRIIGSVAAARQEGNPSLLPCVSREMQRRCTRLLCRGTGSVRMGKDPSRLPERLTDLCFRGRRLAESDPKRSSVY